MTLIPEQSHQRDDHVELGGGNPRHTVLVTDCECSIGSTMISFLFTRSESIDIKQSTIRSGRALIYDLGWPPHLQFDGFVLASSLFRRQTLFAQGCADKKRIIHEVNYVASYTKAGNTSNPYSVPEFGG